MTACRTYSGPTPRWLQLSAQQRPRALMPPSMMAPSLRPADQVQRIGRGAQHPERSPISTGGFCIKHSAIGSVFLVRHFRGEQGRAEGPDELRLGRHAAPAAPNASSDQPDQHRVVGGHAAGHHQGAGQRRPSPRTRLTTERKAPLTMSSTCSPARIFSRISVAAKTVQKLPSGDSSRGSLGQAVEVRQRQVQAIGDFLQERPGAGRALAVHLEARAAAAGVEVDQLAVLGADVDDRHRLAEEVVGALCRGRRFRSSCRPAQGTLSRP